MANKTIPQLTATGAIASGHYLPIDSGVQTFKATVAELAEAFANVTTNRGISVWIATATYGVGAIVSDGTQKGFTYVSLAASNINHALTDAAWWRKTSGHVTTSITGARTLGADDYDSILHVNTTAGAVSLTLFTGGAPRHTRFTVKDTHGTFQTNAVTIVRAGSESIEGTAANYICNRKFGSWTFETDGTNWFLINQAPEVTVLGAWTLGQVGFAGTQTVYGSLLKTIAPAATSAYHSFAISAATQALLGAAGGTDSLITGSALNDFCIAGNVIRFSGNGGTTSHGTVSTSGLWTFGASNNTSAHLFNGQATFNSSQSGASAVYRMANTGASPGSVRFELSAIGVTASTAQYIRFCGGAAGTSNLWDIGSDSSGQFWFAPGGGATCGLISSSGNWTFGASGGASQHKIQGGSTAVTTLILKNLGTLATTRGCALFENVNGTLCGAINITSAEQTQYATTSDERLKHLAEDFSGLDLIERMLPKKYERISDPGVKEFGMYAQELFEVYPQAVSVGGEDVIENPWMIDYGKVTPALVKAVQELKAMNEILIARIESQERSIESLIKEIKNHGK